MSHLTGTSPSRRQTVPTQARKSQPFSWTRRLLEIPLRYKVIAAGALLAVLCSGALWQKQEQSSRPVALFAHTLTPRQLQECSERLASMGLEHKPNSEGNNLLVPPERRLGLLQQLTFEHIPHEDPGEKPTPFNSSSRAQLNHERASLQSNLSQALRTMQGVADATVQIAVSDSAYAEDPPTASVLLSLNPGYEMPRRQAEGIARFISGAVPGLQPQNVAVLDPNGRSPGSNPEGVDSVQFELQQQVDVYMAGKAQRILDLAYGRGQAAVEVNVELDFSQIEVKRTNVGAPGSGGEVVVVENKVDETYKDKKDYAKDVVATRRKSDEAYTWTVQKLPRISRMTCSVLIHSKGQEDNALKLVSGAVGFQPERGDQIQVANVPSPQGTGGKVIVPAPLPPPPAHSAPWDKLIAITGLAGLAGAGLWLLGQRRIQLRRVDLQNAPARGTRTLCDLNHNSQGGSSGEATTAAQVSSRLEELARNQPRETVEKLKSYFGETNRM